MEYDHHNVFAKIIRKEIPCDIIKENKHAIAFKDIAPRAPIHLLIIPKKEYVNYNEFLNKASEEEILDFFRLINELISEFKLDDPGYRLIVNTGENGNQEVKHLHFHLLGGKNLGQML